MKKKAHLMVVDDDAVLCRLLQTVLERAGYRVETATSGTDGQAAIIRGRPDLLLLDLKLRDTDAPKFIAELRELGYIPPFIVITGQGDERAAVQMMKLGALDYLLKDTQFIHFVGTVVERALAQIEMRRQLSQSEEERRRLERELLEISERERRSVGHDLHDGVGQQLTALSLMSHALCESLAASPLLAPAREINQHIRATITETRRLARGLAPVSLDEGGLSDALAELASLAQRTGRARCLFCGTGTTGPADSSMAIHLYRIAQEAVNNAMKHAEATDIRIRLESCAEGLRLEISDNGVGLPASQGSSGMGLRVMDFRARLIGGHVEITSTPGKGVRIVCVCPDSEPASATSFSSPSPSAASVTAGTSIPEPQSHAAAQIATTLPIP